MMTIFYVLIGLYLICLGSRTAGLWASNPVLEGILLMLAGLFLLIAQLIRG